MKVTEITEEINIGTRNCTSSQNQKNQRNCLITEGWVPEVSTEDVLRCLYAGNEHSSAIIPSS